LLETSVEAMERSERLS